MTVRPGPVLVLTALALSACGSGGGGGGSSQPAVIPVPFASVTFSGHAIDNLFFPLVPGTTRVYEGMTPDGLEEESVTVLQQTRVTLGVTCVVVRSTTSLDGSLIEDTLDWYAQDDSGNVWHFGDDTQEIAGGVVTSTEGSWEAGVGGGLAGIIMLAAPTLGATYSMEYGPGVAEDRGRVAGLGEMVATALTSYPGCLHTQDSTPLEPGIVEDKFYAPGVGLVAEVDDEDTRHELVSTTP